jgi:hypothetical protein
MPYQTGLCRPLDPFTKYDVVYTRSFPANNFSISLRPLHLERDIPLLHSWVKREYVRPWWKHTIPFNEIIQTLIHTAHSDFGQVFTGMRGRNNQPLCEIQVFRATQDDELGMSSLVRPGDYVIRLMPNRVVPIQQLAVIQTCLEYFLLHKEVKRILALVDEEDLRDNAVIRKAGFSLLAQVPTAYKMDNLYVYPSE